MYRKLEQVERELEVNSDYGYSLTRKNLFITIVEKTCEYFEYEPSELAVITRLQKVSDARYIIRGIFQELEENYFGSNQSLAHYGALYGCIGRQAPYDHASIKHHQTRYNTFIEIDKEFKLHADIIKIKVNKAILENADVNDKFNSLKVEIMKMVGDSNTEDSLKSICSEIGYSRAKNRIEEQYVV